MSTDARVERAKRFLEKGAYVEAIDTCAEILKSAAEDLDSVSGPDMKETSLVAAKACLLTTDSPSADFSLMHSQLARACEKADSLEEVQEIEEDFVRTFNQWERNCFAKELQKLEEDPTLDAWKKHIRFTVDSLQERLMMLITTRGCSLVTKYCEDRGISKGDYANERESFLEEGMSNREKAELEYQTGQHILYRAKEEIDLYADTQDPKAILGGLKTILREIMVAQQVFKSVNRALKDEDGPARLDGLKAEVEATALLLNTRFYAAGNPMSLYQAGRDVYEKEIADLAETIREIDPTFEPPELLPLVKLPQNISSGSSGGCYVATAVYGSYDCPQVWTLRRYRDDRLAATWYGRAFIHAYYAVSPTLVKWFGDTAWFRDLWKPKLDRMVRRLNREGVEDTPYADRDW